MIIAIDIGSKNTILAGLNNANKLIKKIKFTTPKQAEDCLDLIKATILKDFHGDNIKAIVVGVAGSVHQGLIQWCSNLGEDWNRLDLAEILAETFPKIPILVENDANLAGIYETRILDETPKSAIFLNIGAGIGSSFVLNGKLIPELLQSEAGMTMLEYDGIVRKWEDFASGMAIAETYNMLAKDIKNPAIWDAISDRFSRGLLMLIPIVQPDMIIIGGVMGNYFKRYHKQLYNLIDEKLPPELYRPHIIAAKEPDLAVIYGAGLYFKDKKHEQRFS